jgi:thioredoxin reductase
MSTGEQPRSVAVIGGGPAGCELAYLFAVLGSRVTVLQRNARLIPREEPEASLSLAVRAEVPVAVHADVVHPFPTYAEILEGPLWTLAAQLPGS